MSRIAPKKRVDVSIGAIAVLQRRGINAHLTIAGDGPRDLIQILEETANRLGVSDQVHFIGQVSGEAKETAFRETDVFLLPSADENFGIGLAEALAQGLPAVTTDAVAAARFMTNSTGRVLREATPESVAEAVQDVLAGQRQEYATHAWQCARDNYSWSAVSKQWASTLKVLMKKPL